MKLSSFLKKQNLDQLIKGPTRITMITSTCPDHVYTNNTDVYSHFGKLDPGLSDHFLIFVERKGKRPSQAKKTVKLRNYCFFSPSSFQYDVRRQIGLKSHNVRTPTKH